MNALVIVLVLAVAPFTGQRVNPVPFTGWRVEVVIAKPVAKPVVKPTGHWEQRWRGQVWVEDARSSGTCPNGQCSPQLQQGFNPYWK